MNKTTSAAGTLLKVFCIIVLSSQAFAQDTYNPLSRDPATVEQTTVSLDQQNKYLSRLSYSTPPVPAARLPIDENTKLYVMTVLGPEGFDEESGSLLSNLDEFESSVFSNLLLAILGEYRAAAEERKNRMCRFVSANNGVIPRSQLATAAREAQSDEVADRRNRIAIHNRFIKELTDNLGEEFAEAVEFDMEFFNSTRVHYQSVTGAEFFGEAYGDDLSRIERTCGGAR